MLDIISIYLSVIFPIVIPVIILVLFLISMFVGLDRLRKPILYLLGSELIGIIVAIGYLFYKFSN